MTLMSIPGIWHRGVLGLIPVSCSDATRTLDQRRVDAVVAGPLVDRAIPRPRAARATWTLNAAKLACLRWAISSPRMQYRTFFFPCPFARCRNPDILQIEALTICERETKSPVLPEPMSRAERDIHKRR